MTDDINYIGPCSFRLMPTDDYTDGPSQATLSTLTPVRAPGPDQLCVRYSWVHPTDGLCEGVLLVSGAAEQHGTVTATWADTWHQQPALMTFEGHRVDTHITLHGTYMQEWGWQIELNGVGERSLEMTMRNVVPESALAQLPANLPPMTAGPYDVMRATWSAAT